MPRPIDMHDSVWIEDLTMLEVRDLIKAGKTTALILTGGIEENGPYLTTGKHNNVLKAHRRIDRAQPRQRAGRADRDARAGQSGTRPNMSPGTVVLSQATYRAVLTDMADEPASSQGFKDIVMLGDSGGNIEADAGRRRRAQRGVEGRPGRRSHLSIPEYYNYADVEKFEQETLGIHEKLEGYHDDYYISAIIAT